MHVKKGDNVIVITGKDKGKTGKVLKALPELDKIVIEGINIRKKHRKAKKQGEKGQIVDMTFPIHVSNVKLADAPKPKKTKAKAK